MFLGTVETETSPSSQPFTSCPPNAGTMSQGDLSLALSHGLTAALRHHPSYSAPSQPIYHKKAA